MGLIPLSILNFVLKWRSVQKKAKIFLECIRRSTKRIVTATNPTSISSSDKGADTDP